MRSIDAIGNRLREEGCYIDTMCKFRASSRLIFTPVNSITMLLYPFCIILHSNVAFKPTTLINLKLNCIIFSVTTTTTTKNVVVVWITSTHKSYHSVTSNVSLKYIFIVITFLHVPKSLLRKKFFTTKLFLGICDCGRTGQVLQ